MTDMKRTRNRRRQAIAAIAVVVIVFVAVLVYTQLIEPGNTQPISTGQPQAPTLALNKTGANFADSAEQAVMNIRLLAQGSSATGTPAAALYTSCTVLRGSTPTPSAQAPAATAAATQAATAQATVVPAATQAATPAATASAANYTVFQIAGAQSQACYQVGESLLGKNLPFNLAVGISNAIAGQIAIDKTNVANTQVGQIVVDVSQLTSDESQRDGIIRKRWLESNTYPKATFTPKTITGLPTGPYVDGTPLNFQMTGTMNVHNTDHTETFTVTATLTGTTLVGTASADVLMTDFGFQPPAIPGFVSANNQTHLILNFVAMPVSQ